jgi:hypothetical protein
MKNTAFYIGLLVLCLLSLRFGVRQTEAACNWSVTGSTINATTCGVDGQSTEAYDYSAGTDDSTNGLTLNIPNGVTVTLNTGAVGVPTTLNVGAITITGTGSLVASATNVQIQSGYKCYVTDADADGYSPTPNTCYTTAAAGRIRKFSLNYHAGTDCGDAAAAAFPGAVTARGTTFVNGVNPTLTGDWNCNGVETKTYPTATYTCTGCTNGSGYASFINSSNGFLTSVPACGVAGTYYTVSNATCRDPAVANCSTSVTTSSVTQTCL